MSFARAHIDKINISLRRRVHDGSLDSIEKIQTKKHL